MNHQTMTPLELRVFNIIGTPKLWSFNGKRAMVRKIVKEIKAYVIYTLPTDEEIEYLDSPIISPVEAEAYKRGLTTMRDLIKISLTENKQPK